MRLARAVAAELLIGPSPFDPGDPGCRNGHRRTPRLDRLGLAAGTPSRARRAGARSRA
jgi:hypothetical protein